MGPQYLTRLFRRPLVSTRLLSEYLEVSTIHGVQYIGQASRPYVERLLWIVAVATSICISSVYVIRSYNRWQTNPIQVQMSDSTSMVDDVRSPS